MGKYKSIALENEAIINSGFYTAPNGTRVDLADIVAASAQDTRSYTPNQTAHMLRDESFGHTGTRHPTSFEVTGETSTQAAQRLVRDEHRDRVAVLTFASAGIPAAATSVEPVRRKRTSAAVQPSTPRCLRPLTTTRPTAPTATPDTPIASSTRRTSRSTATIGSASSTPPTRSRS